MRAKNAKAYMKKRVKMTAEDLEKQLYIEREEWRRVNERLNFLIEMSTYPYGGVTVHVEGLGGGRGPDRSAMLSIRTPQSGANNIVVYAPSVNEAIDKAIIRRELLEDLQRKMDELGVDYKINA